MINAHWRRMCVPPIVLLLAACGTPRPPTALYVLGDLPSPTRAVSQTPITVVELTRVGIPDFLDSTDILRRTGPNTVTASVTGRWGERLSLGLGDSIASHLANRLPESLVTTNPTADAAQRISVTVEQFEIGVDGLCLVTAHWRVTAGDRKSAARNDRGMFPVMAASTSDADEAAAMTQALDQMSDRLVDDLSPASLPQATNGSAPRAR